MDNLKKYFKNYYVLNDISGILFWDNATNLPAKSIESRSDQMSILAEYIDQELLNSAKSQAETISKNIVDKTAQAISSKEKNSLERIKQIEISAIQSIKNQASIELNNMITNYLSNLSDSDRNKVLEKSVSDFKSIN